MYVCIRHNTVRVILHIQIVRLYIVIAMVHVRITVIILLGMPPQEFSGVQGCLLGSANLLADNSLPSPRSSLGEGTVEQR